MTRPLYRWKSFWLGVLVLVFLGWACWDSFRHESQVWVGCFGKCVWLIRSGGATFYEFEWSLPAFDIGATREPVALNWGETSAMGPHIADAPLIGGLSLAWLAFLAWRWRRMRRGAASN